MSQTFRNAESALKFAFHFSDQVYDRPTMNRMADEPVKTVGESLNGLDGAGQAAMIFNQVLRLSEMQQFVLYAAFAPRMSPCSCGRPCCRGYTPNPAWDACIIKIEVAAITRALAGCLSHRVLRRGIVRRIFGDKSEKLKDLAARCEVDENTASNQNVRVKAWLEGTRQDGWTTGIKPRAIAQLEQMLRFAGIIDVAEAIS